MVRLDKFLADAGYGTRNEVKKLIKSRQVSVHDAIVTKPEQKIDADADVISVKGERVSYTRFHYYLFHKPGGCVTAKTDPKDQTVMDFFPEELRGKLSPVGRLDKDTEGLLLVTNDGELNHRLTSPAYHQPKTYYARLDGQVPREAVELFSHGVDIGDERQTLPASLTILPDETKDGGIIYAAQLTIGEGRYHQVKRMFQAVGCRVIYLKRLSMGTLSLGNLPKGEYRPLTEAEQNALKKECEMKGYQP